MTRDAERARTARDAGIVSRLASGALRRDEPVKTRLARGRDGACAACDASLETTEFTTETAFADRATLHFHRDCYYAWHDARASEQRTDRQALWRVRTTGG